MRTNLSEEQLSAPLVAAAERNLRACVHCGICTATCPTYVLFGDERDGPRGRIVMMQRMLEDGGVPTEETVHHVDRCLTCLGCRTACPSSVDYARLIDAAREHIEAHYTRPLHQRLLRALILRVMPRPLIVKLGVALARFTAPISTRLPGSLGAMARIAAAAQPRAAAEAVAVGMDARRVALLPGCVQQALAPSIDRAAARVLARRGMALAPLKNAGCCGALAHHLGRRDEAKALARRIIVASETDGAHAILITASGCAAHLADYPHLFCDEPAWQARAETFAKKVRDFARLASPRAARAPRGLKLAHHVPCSEQHGLRHAEGCEAALAAAGYAVQAVPEGHLCCGSAGSYSLLQPEIAGRLRRRKLENIATLDVDAVAAANIGCLTHLSGRDAPPIVHPAELIDWAEGGPEPQALARRKNSALARKTG